MKKRNMFQNQYAAALIPAVVLCLSLALVLPAKAKETRATDLSAEQLRPSDARIDDIQVTFMNRNLMSPSMLGGLPGNFRPPQCPYDTWSRGVNLPFLGDVDVKLFCVPKEQTENAPDEKVGQKP